MLDPFYNKIDERVHVVFIKIIVQKREIYRIPINYLQNKNNFNQLFESNIIFIFEMSYIFDKNISFFNFILLGTLSDRQLHKKKLITYRINHFFLFCDPSLYLSNKIVMV